MNPDVNNSKAVLSEAGPGSSRPTLLLLLLFCVKLLFEG